MSPKETREIGREKRELIQKGSIGGREGDCTRLRRYYKRSKGYIAEWLTGGFRVVLGKLASNTMLVPLSALFVAVLSGYIGAFPDNNEQCFIRDNCNNPRTSHWTQAVGVCKFSGTVYPLKGYTLHTENKTGEVRTMDISTKTSPVVSSSGKERESATLFPSGSIDRSIERPGDNGITIQWESRLDGIFKRGLPCGYRHPPNDFEASSHNVPVGIELMFYSLKENNDEVELLPQAAKWVWKNKFPKVQPLTPLAKSTTVMSVEFKQDGIPRFQPHIVGGVKQRGVEDEVLVIQVPVRVSEFQDGSCEEDCRVASKEGCTLVLPSSCDVGHYRGIQQSDSSGANSDGSSPKVDKRQQVIRKLDRQAGTEIVRQVEREADMIVKLYDSIGEGWRTIENVREFERYDGRWTAEIDEESGNWMAVKIDKLAKVTDDEEKPKKESRRIRLTRLLIDSIPALNGKPFKVVELTYRDDTADVIGFVAGFMLNDVGKTVERL